LKIIRLISNAIRISTTTASSIIKIDAEIINISADEPSFPFTGGSLCELEDSTGVGDDIIVGVSLGITVAVATGVEVATIVLGVGLG
jgi:hypothetical protein